LPGEAAGQYYLVDISTDNPEYTNLDFGNFRANPLLNISKTVVSVDSAGDGVANAAGDVITYEVVVSNAGNQVLTNVQVNDPLTGLKEEIGSLAIGEQKTYQTSYTLKPGDLVGVAADGSVDSDGDIDNRATADSDQTGETFASTETEVFNKPASSPLIAPTGTSIQDCLDGTAQSFQQYY